MLNNFIKCVVLLSYAATYSIDILEMDVMPDHLAILAKVDQQIGFDNAVKSFKGYTSRVLRNEFPFVKTTMLTLWTNSYFMSAVGSVSLEVIQLYMENQKTTQRHKVKLGQCEKGLNLEFTQTGNSKIS